MTDQEADLRKTALSLALRDTCTCPLRGGCKHCVATIMAAKVKAKNSREAAAQKLAQRKLEFDQKLQMEARKTSHEIHLTNLKSIHEAARNGESGSED